MARLPHWLVIGFRVGVVLRPRQAAASQRAVEYKDSLNARSLYPNGGQSNRSPKRDLNGRLGTA
jgi:hypothetical protein